MIKFYQVWGVDEVIEKFDSLAAARLFVDYLKKDEPNENFYIEEVIVPVIGEFPCVMVDFFINLKDNSTFLISLPKIITQCDRIVCAHKVFKDDIYFFRVRIKGNFSYAEAKEEALKSAIRMFNNEEHYLKGEHI